MLYKDRTRISHTYSSSHVLLLFDEIESLCVFSSRKLHADNGWFHIWCLHLHHIFLDQIVTFGTQLSLMVCSFLGQQVQQCYVYAWRSRGYRDRGCSVRRHGPLSRVDIWHERANLVPFQMLSLHWCRMYDLPAPMLSTCLVVVVTRFFSFQSSGWCYRPCWVLEVLNFFSNSILACLVLETICRIDPPFLPHWFGLRYIISSSIATSVL